METKQFTEVRMLQRRKSVHLIYKIFQNLEKYKIGEITSSSAQTIKNLRTYKREKKPSWDHWFNKSEQQHCYIVKHLSSELVIWYIIVNSAYSPVYNKQDKDHRQMYSIF